MLTSRKWKALLCDAVFAAIVLVVTTWLGDPKWQEFALKLIAIVQPVVIAYILGTAWEDSAKKAATVFNVGEAGDAEDDAPK